MGINIAIDGPAGAGKSTIAKKVAKELSFIYVDTGAMYRAMALYLLEKGISGDEKISEACHDADISIRYENGEQQVILNGKNVTAFLRKEEVGNMNNTVSLTKQNGEKIQAEIISYFEIVETQKRYLFYTLNEAVENGLVKMYVSEVSDSMNVTDNITDDEWNKIKVVMKSILTNSNSVEIKYLKWED